MPDGNFSEILKALKEREVEFIVVGGLAAILGGAPINSFDVDVVHSRDAANIERLLAVLESLDAIFRIQPDRRLKPNASHLSGPGLLNLVTRYGWLDVLGAIGRGLSYPDLLPHSTEMEIGGGLRVRVLDLETLIALKEDLGREKDLAVLATLRATLEEKRKK
jgi:predicted nucleotidyltransferase